MEILQIIANPEFWFGVLRSTTPILLAGMAALMASRAGITNMALEGIMLFSALFGVVGSAIFQNPWMGLLFAVIIGVVISLGLAFFSIKMNADPIMVAIAINLLAEGLTVFLLFLLTGDKSQSTALHSINLPTVNIPLIAQIPFLGAIVSGHNIIVYVTIALVFAVNFLLFKTPLGLRIRSVGGNPNAAASVGISVQKTQFIALALSGVLGGIAGAFLSMGYMSVFIKGMTAGRGYIALAVASVGGGAPIGTMFASLLFGVFEALANNLQGLQLLPVEFIYMIPYIATIVMFTFASYRRLTAKKRKAKQLLKPIQG